MKKSHILSIIFLGAVFITTNSEPSETNINGLWCTQLLIYKDKKSFDERYSKKIDRPKKSCILFTNEGDFIRHSANKGERAFNGKYRMNGDEIQLLARNKKNYLPMGKLIAPSQLLMDFKRGRKMVLNKMPDGTDPKSLDLDTVLPVEFETHSTLNNEITPKKR
ncbi:MAG: hypothetical protein ABW076_18725 [Candidatus Thiodiazotropha sp.]